MQKKTKRVAWNSENATVAAKKFCEILIAANLGFEEIELNYDEKGYLKCAVETKVDWSTMLGRFAAMAFCYDKKLPKGIITVDIFNNFKLADGIALGEEVAKALNNAGLTVVKHGANAVGDVTVRFNAEELLEL